LEEINIDEISTRVSARIPEEAKPLLLAKRTLPPADLRLLSTQSGSHTHKTQWVAHPNPSRGDKPHR
jgi:hypothetical protein